MRLLDQFLARDSAGVEYTVLCWLEDFDRPTMYGSRKVAGEKLFKLKNGEPLEPQGSRTFRTTSGNILMRVS